MPVARGPTAPPLLAGRRRLPDVCRRTGFIVRIAQPDAARHSHGKRIACAGDRRRSTSSISEDRAPGYRRPRAHPHADRIGERESTGPARMTGYQPDPPRTGRGEVACRRVPAGSKVRGRPAMGRITAIAACRPRRVEIVHFSTPYSSRCLCRQPDTAGAPTIRRRRPMPPGTGPCCPSGRHPRGLRPSRFSNGSLPNRPDVASSTLAPQPVQGARQLRSGPAAQAFHRTSARPGRAGHAGRCETETCRARAASVAWRQRLAGQGARTSRKIFPARAARRRPRLPGLFAQPPAGNVSRPLHAAGRPRTDRPRTLPGRLQPTRWWSASSGGEPSFPPLSPELSWSLSPCSIIIRYSVTREMPSSAAALLIR